MSAFSRSLLLIMSLSFVLISCGRVTDQVSDLSIVGGEIVEAGHRSPAIGLLVKSLGNGGVFYTKTCTASRIGPNLFLTSADCLEAHSRLNESIYLLRSSSGKTYFDVDFNQVALHPEYNGQRGNQSAHNIALFDLKNVPEALNQDIPIASISYEEPTKGNTIFTYGVGCEEAEANGECLGGATIFKYMKLLKTTVQLAPSDLSILPSHFTSNPVDGHIADGDLGGPVFDASGQLIALNTLKKGLMDTEPAYLWLGSASNKQFILDIRSRGFGTDQQGPFWDEILSIRKEIYKQLVDCGYDASQHNIFSAFLDLPDEPSLYGCMTISSQAREVRIKSLLLSAAMTELAELEFRNGNIENAEALLRTARIVLVTALEIGISISPLGRAKDIIECATGYSIIPGFNKLEDLDQIFACLGAIGLDRKIIELVSAGVNKTGILTKIIDSASRLGSKVNWAKSFGANGGAITNRGRQAFAERTQPTLPKGGKPRGTYETPDPNNPQSIVRQNESADLLAKEGYDVEMLREVRDGNGYGVLPGSNPDLKINDRVFDVYTPESSNPYSIWKNLQTKTVKQSRRIVLNLDETNVDINDLVKQFNDWPIHTLDEIIVVRQGRLVNWFPF